MSLGLSTEAWRYIALVLATILGLYVAWLDYERQVSPRPRRKRRRT